MNQSASGAAREFVRAINRQDIDALASLMTPDHTYIDSLGDTVAGRDRMRAGWAGYFSMVPDSSITIEESYGDGDVVVLLGVAQGTYKNKKA